MDDASNTDRAQLAELSTSAKAYLVTLETMRALVEELHTERDQARAELEETRTMLDIGWKPATCSLLADELSVLHISLGLQPASNILLWCG